MAARQTAVAAESDDEGAVPSGSSEMRSEPPTATAEAPPDAKAAGTTEAPRRDGGRFAGLAPFQSRAYRYLFVGTMLTMTGNFMQQVAQGWLIYNMTSSPTWLGIVSFARGIPMLILALVAGVVVDRFDRRIVLLTAQGL